MPPESKLPVAPGQIIGGRYLIGNVIGEGGMGVVCAATHVGLGTQVAIKLIHSDLKHDLEAVQRFLNEARTAASLKGDHIARVFDVGQLDSGEPYLVMEQLEGVGLDAFIQEHGALGQAEAVDIVLQACEGLAEAHAVSLVHRDIKPANLFLTRRMDGTLVLKILDFGISKRLVDRATRGLTNPGTSLGSPWYMSPEQMLTPSSVDQRADVWSLGVLLYELLTNSYPFAGDSVPQVCASVLTAAAPHVSAERPDVDPDLDGVILRCLEKEVARRYASVEELAEALRPFASLATASGLPLSEPRAFQAGRALRRTPTTGSLAPMSAHHAPARSRVSSLTVVALGMLAVGVALAGFALPYAGSNQLVGELAELPARARLPWDPELRADPLDASSLAPRLVPAPNFLQAFVASAAVSPPAEALLPEHDEASPAPPPTPAELRERAERYERWLREQGLARIAKPPSDEPEAQPDESVPDNQELPHAEP